MKLLVIMTGGTIGCRVEGEWLTPDEACSYSVIDRFVKKNPNSDVEFVIITPYTTLSEQVTHIHINALIDCVQENLNSDIQGVIITHGTDTLPYVAAGLGYIFSKQQIPIVFVSANYPPDDRRSNAHMNFNAAVDFIRSRGGRGVFVSYRNADGVTRLHRATRLLAHRECDDAVYSIANRFYAICEDNVIIRNTAYRPTEAATGYEHARFSPSAQVLTVQCKPGEGYDYNLEHVKAILLQPYHSGTVNTRGEAFEQLCRRAAAMNIPVFLVNVRSGLRYESAARFDELGICALPLCAFIPMYMKLWLATSIGADHREFALQPLAEEFIVQY